MRDSGLFLRFLSQKILLLFIFVFPLLNASTSYAGSATTKLIEELTNKWSSNENELNMSCSIGKDLNSDALSFWNAIIVSKRVEAFGTYLKEARLYAGKSENLDKDTIASFADAKEAALLRAMRKRCPDVW